MSNQVRHNPCAYQRNSWLAHYHGDFVAVDGVTQMGKTQSYGPLRVQRPFFPEGGQCLHLYLLHPPGGMVGGDQLSIELNAKCNSHLLMTTPSAGKFYRNISQLKQKQLVKMTVAENAVLEYFPQENIIFDGANAMLTTDIELTANGQFIGWEISCLGRNEGDHFFNKGSLQQALSISRDGIPVFIDRFNLEAPSRLQQSQAGLADATVMGSFIVTNEVVSKLGSETLAQWQATIQQTLRGGELAITQKPGVFIARAKGCKVEAIRHAFEALWVLIRPAIINRIACPPRIWRT